MSSFRRVIRKSVLPCLQKTFSFSVIFSLIMQPMAAPILLGAFVFSVPTKVIAQETEPVEEVAPVEEEEVVEEEAETSVEEVTNDQETTEEETDSSEQAPAVTEDTDQQNIAEDTSGDEEGEQVCLSLDESVTESSKDDWKAAEDRKSAETKEKVELGIRYVYPENKDVSITFTCLPADKEKRASLKIEEIDAAEIQLPEGMVIASEFAYDITTEGMKNGDFKYDLSLPKQDGREVGVAYIEKDADEVKGKDLQKSDIKNVDKEDLDNETDTVEASDLDHFTVVFPIILTGQDKKIDICHATSAEEVNPYNKISVNVNSVDNQGQCQVGSGNNGHGEHENDIIPPFSTESCSYEGKNWQGATNQAIWNTEDCSTKSTLTIIKRAEPKDGQDFPFTTTGTGLSSFTLDDDENSDATFSNSKTFGNLNAGQYSITETAVEGWQLVDVACVVEGGESLNLTNDGNTISVPVGMAQSVVCTFINIKNKPVCGDGVKNDGEACDYGSANGSSSCSNTCQFVAPVCSVEPTTITNGEFESPDVANNQWEIFSDAATPGWSLEWYGGNTTFGVATRPEPQMELHAGVNGWTSSNDQYVELDTDWDGPSGSLNGEPASISLYQDLPTVVGNEYTFSWDYAGRPKHDNNRLKVEVEGEVFDSGVIGGGGDDTVDWITETITFTATSSITRIRFTETGTPDSLGMFVDNVRLSCKESIRTATVRVCKINQNQTPLPNWTLMLEKDVIQSDLVVPATSSAGVNSTPLIPGASYIAKASGTWANQGGVNLVDAEYSTTDGFATHTDGYPGYQDDILELQINGAFDPSSDWGAYNSAHTYAQAFVPTIGGPANFRIFDGTGSSQNESWFTDNTGNLLVDIVSGYAGITGENGCVTFENVPYGSYTKNEIMQDGWQNVSGLDGAAVIDSPEETFTIINREVPKAAKISATKVVCDDEMYLPNMSGGDAITGTTASAWVAQSGGHCQIEQDWDFQWSRNGGAFGDFQTNTTSLGDPWETFSSQIALPVDTLGQKVEVREVFPDNSYIPFTNSANPVSAEIYCADDVSGYDNWDWITNIQEDTTYHCVAFNAKKKGTLTVVKNVVNDNGQQKTAQNFSFQVDGGTATAFEEDGTNVLEVTAGTYSVTEVADSAYETTYENCSQIVVPAGGNATCTITNNDKAPVRVVATKIVCTDEADLPNYGTGGPNIGATSAADWVASHDTCSLAPDWQFQWSYDGTAHAGDNVALGGAGWTTSEVTDGSGQVTLEIPNPDNSPKLWFREINKENFIPFSLNEPGGANNANSVSAEIYCHDDVLNYDNWDWVGNPQNGSTYYCVAWNAPKTGTITIVKDAINNNPQNFAFSTNFDASPNPGNQTSFQLDDDSNATLSNSRTFTLPIGNYTVQEGTALSWKLTDLTCNDENGSIDLLNRKATISLDANEAVVCTFSNTQLGYIKGLKFNDKNTDAQWNLFQGELGLGNWRIFVDQDNDQTYDNGEPTTLTSNFFLTRGVYLLEGMLPGNYQVCEEMQSGWNHATPLCQSVELTPGDLKVVNFGNFENGQLIIDKVTVPGQDPTEFLFNATGPAEFTSDFSLTDQAPAQNLSVVPGSYTVTETPNALWDTTVSCDNQVQGDQRSEVDSLVLVDEIPTNTKTVQVGSGQTVTCTFTNTKKPVTVIASKIVCDTEADLPNYGGALNELIDENTAQEWVTNSEGACRFQEGWDFQWGPKDSGDAGDDLIGPAGGTWNAFGVATNSSGTAVIEIPNTVDFNGRLEIREVLQENYIPFGQSNEGSDFSAEMYCGGDAVNYDNWEWINNPVSGTTYHCVAWNVLKTGTITGYKFSDINGDGNQDDGEGPLAGWTLYLDLNNSGTFDEGEPSGVTGEDGQYIFSNLIPGNYVVREVQQSGWEQTADSCTLEEEDTDEFPNEDVRLQVLDISEGGMRLLPGASIQTCFGNQNQAELSISKKEFSESAETPNNVVTYEIQVQSENNTVEDVLVTDLPPEGFDVIEGTETLDSSIDGAHTGSLELSKEYASPGEWSIGDVQPGETITLRYQARISSTQDEGIYRDLAYARGSAQGGGDVLAIDLLDADNFAATEVAVALAEQNKVKIDEDEEVETDKDKEYVLGASLPATGATTSLLVFALALMLAGGALILSDRRKKLMKVLILGVVLSSTLFGSAAQAEEASVSGLAVTMEDPDAAVTSSNFKIGFVSLDIHDRTVEIACYANGVLYDTENLIAGGSSGDCQVNSTAMPVAGTYDFYVTATVDEEGGGTLESKHESVKLVTGAPGKPREYERDEATCDDKISFRTDSDGGRTVKVEVYRSKNKTFVANATTLVETLAIGSDTEGTITTTPPSCNEDYWYAIRAVDADGIGSEFVGDVDVDVTTDTRTETITRPGEQAASGALPVTAEAGATTEGGAVEGAATGEGAGENGAEVLGEMTEDGQSGGSAWMKDNKGGLFIGAILILGALYYLYARRRRIANASFTDNE